MEQPMVRQKQLSAYGIEKVRYWVWTGYVWNKVGMHSIVVH